MTDMMDITCHVTIRTFSPTAPHQKPHTTPQPILPPAAPAVCVGQNENWVMGQMEGGSKGTTVWIRDGSKEMG